ncbi:MAG TPA: iron-sulfur cluster carrier protein ApbC [bacterium]|nr:iron-sulfur cluster carrier protein ApbC [bacterium]
MSGKLSEQEVIEVLSQVKDPETHLSIVKMNMIKDVKVDNGKVDLTVVLTTPACPLKGEIKSRVEKALYGLPGVQQVEIKMDANVPTQKRPLVENLLPDVRNSIAVASGKGGVGKSTVAVNMAVALARTGANVGLLDADCYGPSIPLMMGVNERPRSAPGTKKILPLESYGVKLMSLGFFLDDNAPVIWRGPMVTSAIQQMLGEVEWGDLDYLLVDLPPGTGDIHLTLTQKVPLSGAVVVSTPQDVALIDARKGLAMFQKVNVPVLGIIENMSYFVCPHCKERTNIFSHGGVRKACEELGVPFLGEIPLDPNICSGGDEGKPIVIADPDSPQSKAFMEVVGTLAASISVRSFLPELRIIN